MRSLALTLLAALTAPPLLPVPRLTAQTRDAPNLVLTISGGLTTAGRFWTLDRQLFPVPPNQVDSFALGRRFRPGIVAAVAATYQPGQRLGYTLEVGYFGLATESRCSPLGPYAPDPENTTKQACDRIQGEHQPSSAVGFQVGLTYRIAPSQALSPYLRGSGGLAVLGRSFVQTEAVVTSSQCDPGPSCVLALLREGKRRELTLVATLAGGFTIAASPGYRVRLEVRDLIASVPGVDGPAPLAPGPQGPADVSARFRHVAIVTAGLDVVLERRHRRRY